jgi:hypothetical protein
LFTCASQDGGAYEVLAECTDSIEKILERATRHYHKTMRDVVYERRLTRLEEQDLIPRLGWGLRASPSKRSKPIEDL